VAEPFTISLTTGPTDAVSALEYAAEGTRVAATLILGHGAGAPQSSGWMVQTARGLATRGIDVVTFNFPYSELRKGVPDRAEVLEATYIATIQAARARPTLASNRLFIGGKSMGGRMASHVASKWEEPAGPGGALAGLIFFGYPLHPPGKPQQPRSAHLPLIKAPMLFIQGSRDAFGTADELQTVLANLPAKATLAAVEGGDHSFKVPKSAPLKQPQVDQNILDTAARWIASARAKSR
jgi:predicted alpha/beta-hydrolase family hydrolase